jgi:hypothetical protein
MRRCGAASARPCFCAALLLPLSAGRNPGPQRTDRVVAAWYASCCGLRQRAAIAAGLFQVPRSHPTPNRQPAQLGTLCQRAARTLRALRPSLSITTEFCGRSLVLRARGSSLLSGVRRAAAERFATSPDRPVQARQLNTGVKGDIKLRGNDSSLLHSVISKFLNRLLVLARGPRCSKT